MTHKTFTYTLCARRFMKNKFRIDKSRNVKKFITSAAAGLLLASSGVVMFKCGWTSGLRTHTVAYGKLLPTTV